MSSVALLPVLVPLVSFATGLTIFVIGDRRPRARNALNLGGSLLKLALVIALLQTRSAGLEAETRLAFLPGVDFVLRGDFLALLFLALSSLLWLLTTVYAIGYLKGEAHRTRFFGYFSLCIAATSGIALAGNLVTFFVFYEILTLATFPLLVHRGTGDALAAGRVYLLYTLTGGIVFLAGVAWLHGMVGPVEFRAGGVLAGAGAPSGALASVFAVLMLGLGVKTALIPLHGWLPRAMVAPAPVSALLHAVAVVKAGAFGIVRVIYDVYGLEFAAGLGVLGPLALWAAITIIYGSFRALVQDDLKRMLAFSTVSQLSYIVLGAAVPGAIATAGALAHLVHQGIMKITLFYCAGVMTETLRVKNISDMGGIGRRLPLTAATFTIAALGMIGVPPTAGFVSKWYLATGGLAAGQPWVVAVMVASALLNMMYFLPVIRTMWFDEPSEAVREAPARSAGWMLLGPPLLTAAATLLAGVLAGIEFSPLGIALRAVGEAYAP